MAEVGAELNVDLDSLKWWTDFAHKCLTSAGVAWLAIDRFWERFLTVEKFIERRTGGDRRHTVGIIAEGELILGLIPKIEKIVSDARAAEQTPQVQQLIADLQAVVAEVKAAVATPPATPAA